MSKVSLNINEIVEVRLTDEGRRLIGHEYDGVEQPDGTQRWQLWCLMASAGPHLWLGGETLLFRNEVVIDLDQVRPVDGA